MVSSLRLSICVNQRVLRILIILIMSVNCGRLFTGSNKHPELGLPSLSIILSRRAFGLVNPTRLCLFIILLLQPSTSLYM
ncbi:hypothetical protein MtrunA17_Chr3g0107571 [Medicago truncatula]|uniref:Uncharacterized protein n=1 Tax=Medicago truncatula TaxID=3880 RepID=A0A396ITS7_MEDTR|nr:hypothetical protein MtrunA17_Chr3g0107571 [Medicago truncatula]